jgi:hypothetical protein
MVGRILSMGGGLVGGVGLVYLALLLLMLGTAMPVQAAPDPTIHCVNQTGTGCAGECGSCHSTVQAAIDASAATHKVRLAGGTYAPGSTVAVITKELLLQGGYSSDFTIFDPAVYESVLDAGWAGSVISITNASTVFLQHLKVTHGVGTGNCGSYGCGGGIFASGTDLQLHDCFVVDNHATTYGAGAGAGVYAGALGHSVDIWDSRIADNVSSPDAYTSTEYGYGGGIMVYEGHVRIWDSQVDNNVGSVLFGGSGGIHLGYVDSASVTSNTIFSNRSCLGNYYGGGGGVYVEGSSSVYIASNHIEDNWGGKLASYGGCIYVNHSDSWIDGNWVISNSTGTSAGHGGGVCIFGETPVTVTNNVIARNYAGNQGGGVYVYRSVAPASEGTLVNNTVVDNGDTGIVAGKHATMTLRNNLIAGHTSGLSKYDPISVVIDADTNLFWNDNDPITGVNAVLADPRLAATYWLREGSPALDAGLNISWLTQDIDGRPRPWNAYDIGAYEVVGEALYLPLLLRG